MRRLEQGPDYADYGLDDAELARKRPTRVNAAASGRAATNNTYPLYLVSQDTIRVTGADGVAGFAGL